MTTCPGMAVALLLVCGAILLGLGWALTEDGSPDD